MKSGNWFHGDHRTAHQVYANMDTDEIMSECGRIFSNEVESAQKRDSHCKQCIATKERATRVR